MAGEEQAYLRDCLEKSICPACQKSLASGVGSGQLKDGVFCSLDCYARWKQGELWKRHQGRLKKGRFDD